MLDRLLFPLLIALLLGCAAKEETGPGEVRWDRDVCARCAMAVSDHHYSAQVRGGSPEKRTRLYKFDDLGCAVIWLDGQAWSDDPRTEIWVNDHESGDWLDARAAWYIAGKTTPMDYGLGARSEKTDSALNFHQAAEHIHRKDKRPEWRSHEQQHVQPDDGETR